MGHLRRRLLLIAIALSLVLAGGTIGFMLIEHYPMFDAFYMTLTTVTTVGYAEIRGLSHAGRVFNSFLILIGVTTIFLAVGAMTQTAIELELNQFFGKRRVRSMIDKLEGHIILCGFGRVGRGAAEELRKAGASFVVVDKSEERVERAMKAGMLAVLADASRDETLRDVGIARAKGLIATLASDADNLFVILSAKTLNPNLQLSARIAEESSEVKMRRAGADYVFAPYNSTGHRMAQALLKPHVLQFLDFTTQKGVDMEIEQLRVTDGCSFAGRTLAQVDIRRQSGVVILAIRKIDGEMLFNPAPEVKMTAGDHLIAMGDARNLQKLEQLLLMGVASA
ncbi:MAG TPA: potassium channel protein [Bryobacteraceae bacterium]|jgi:voltage-gated potassium channel|nr:potassium channel protein [Bryobacteraceae bacterium]